MVIMPLVVMRPMDGLLALFAKFVNHNAPSGPATMVLGSLTAVCEKSGKLAITPPTVMRPIEFPEELVNHKAPSGPVVIPAGPLTDPLA